MCEAIPSQIQASSVHTRPQRMSLLTASIQDTDVTILLDSGSSFSSISEDLVCRLQLQIIPTTPISVLFGDHQKVYRSNSSVNLTITINRIQFSHACYVLPKQVFPVTFGCDWFEKTQAQLDFKRHALLLPNHVTIPFKHTVRSSAFQNLQIEGNSPQSKENILLTLLKQFPGILPKDGQCTVTSVPVYHKIQTTSSRPIKMAQRRRSPKENDVINNAVDDMLKRDVIQPSQSPWAAEPHLVKKDSGEYRFCVDF